MSAKIEYLYPLNMLDGTWDEKQGNRRVTVRLSNYTGGTDETDAIKIRLSDLKTHAGKVPRKTAVEWIQYDIFGLTCVLEWDRAPHAEIIRLNAHAVSTSGRIDWTQFGGTVDPGGDDDRTGNILLTTSNDDAGDSYEIIICLRLKD